MLSINRFNSERLVSINLLLVLIFGYYSIFDIRVIGLFAIPIFTCIAYWAFVRNCIITKDYLFIYSIFLTLVIFLFSLYKQNYNFLFSIIIFFLLSYWPIFTPKVNINELSLKIKRVYIFGGCVLAIGLVIQLILYKYYNFSFGQINQYGGGRVAYGLFWKDYSFLSLYLTSIIPLIYFGSFKFSYKAVLIGLLIVGSLITSARTGIFSLVLVSLLYFFVNIISFLRLKRFYYSLFVFFVAILIFVFLQENVGLMNRTISASSSGRFDGYYEALGYFSNNLIWGTGFSPETYSVEVGVIPHNIFIYSLSVGGVFFFMSISFLIGYISVISIANRDVFLSFLICMLGFQFIPSLFSAYFFAVLISICMLEFRR